MYVCWRFQGASTSQVIGARNEMIMDDYEGQMMFRDLVGLKLPDICLTGEVNPRKNLTQETCPDRESNLGPLRDKRASYHLLHSDNCQEIWATFVPGYHMAIIYYPNQHLSTDGDGL